MLQRRPASQYSKITEQSPQNLLTTCWILIPLYLSFVFLLISTQKHYCTWTILFSNTCYANCFLYRNIPVIFYHHPFILPANRGLFIICIYSIKEFIIIIANEPKLIFKIRIIDWLQACARVCACVGHQLSTFISKFGKLTFSTCAL